MSPAFWIAVLSVLSPALSVSVGSGQNLVLPASSTDQSSVQLIQPASESLPWTIGSSSQTLPPLSTRLNMTMLSRGIVSYECDKRPFSLGDIECREAWRQIPRSDGTQYSLGNRSADQTWDVPLPMRWPSDKGNCNIEIDQIEEGTIKSDYASGPEISNAALVLINRCTVPTGQGGIAKPLGHGGRLAVTIKPYRPNLKCDNPDAPVRRLGPTGHVQSILNKMKVSKWGQIFGKAGSPNVQVPLPITIPDPSGKYFVTVDIEGAPVSAKWYDLWTDAVAVTGVCVRNDKWGVSTREVAGSQGVSKITVKIHSNTANAALSSTA